MFSIVLHFSLGHFTSLTNANHQRGGEGARSEASFLSSSIDEGSESDSWFSSQIKSSDSLGAIDLMSADAHKINFLFVDVYFDLPNSLSCVGMEEDSFFSAKFPYFFHVLNNPDFVMDEDDADTQNGLF